MHNPWARKNRLSEPQRVIEAIRPYGNDYVRAIRIGFLCTRAFYPPVNDEILKEVALVDLVRESPTIAAYALRGMAISEDACDRKLAAEVAPHFADAFPEQTVAVLVSLMDDPDASVADAASTSAWFLPPALG